MSERTLVLGRLQDARSLVTRLTLGAVILAHFPEHGPHGREQEGRRPAVLVGEPALAGSPRFPMVLVAPVTSERGSAWESAAPHLYIRLPAGTGGLPGASIVLTDQVRSLDVTRVIRRIGTLREEEYTPIRDALRMMMGL